MAELSLSCSPFSPSTLSVRSPLSPKATTRISITTFASKSRGSSFIPAAKRCKRCGGQGAIECPGCKGTGKNKKNGNIFERWKCFDCQGFGLRSCPDCGKGGLTPEQRGER